MLLSIVCGFDDMVKKKSMSGDTGEECLEGIIQTAKNLIAQVDIKIKDAGVSCSTVLSSLDTHNRS